jgi:predicted nucleotidyltransferase component of viral defense system
MIPENFLEHWKNFVKWQTLPQIEQDLAISRVLVNLYNEPYIKDALVFRGGTALNKLFLNPPARYSEDIDFVQKRPEPIGKTIDTIRMLLDPWLDEPKRKITERCAKLIYKYESVHKVSTKLKIEINTTEHFQVLPLRTEKFTVESEWFSGSADIVTYEIDELMATKLRALYQRRKGRDLFDVWYVAKQQIINLSRVFEIYSKYCANDNTNIRKEDFLQNLELKKSHNDFKSDMSFLLPVELNWSFEEAYQFVIDNVISKMP